MTFSATEHVQLHVNVEALKKIQAFLYALPPVNFKINEYISKLKPDSRTARLHGQADQGAGQPL